MIRRKSPLAAPPWTWEPGGGRRAAGLLSAAGSGVFLEFHRAEGGRAEGDENLLRAESLFSSPITLLATGYEPAVIWSVVDRGRRGCGICEMKNR